MSVFVSYVNIPRHNGFIKLDIMGKFSNTIAIAALILAIVAFVRCSCPHNESLMVNSGRMVTLHYTDWCPHCATMKPEWAKVRSAMSGNGIKFIENDEVKNPTAGINHYPTIRMLLETGQTVEYSGGPSAESLKSWILAQGSRY